MACIFVCSLPATSPTLLPSSWLPGPLMTTGNRVSKWRLLTMKLQWNVLERANLAEAQLSGFLPQSCRIDLPGLLILLTWSSHVRCGQCRGMKPAGVETDCPGFWSHTVSVTAQNLVYHRSLFVNYPSNNCHFPRVLACTTLQQALLDASEPPLSLFGGRCTCKCTNGTIAWTSKGTDISCLRHSL